MYVLATLQARRRKRCVNYLIVEGGIYCLESTVPMQPNMGRAKHIFKRVSNPFKRVLLFLWTVGSIQMWCAPQ